MSNNCSIMLVPICIISEEAAPCGLNKAVHSLRSSPEYRAVVVEWCTQRNGLEQGMEKMNPIRCTVIAHQPKHRVHRIKTHALKELCISSNKRNTASEPGKRLHPESRMSLFEFVPDFSHKIRKYSSMKDQLKPTSNSSKNARRA